jgi:hypothetical protein
MDFDYEIYERDRIIDLEKYDYGIEYCHLKQIAAKIYELSEEEIKKPYNKIKIFKPAFIFGFIIYFCDEFIRFKQTEENENVNKIKRFFNITKRLPIELQMLISNKIYDFDENLILTKHSNKIFELFKDPLFWKGEKINYIKRFYVINL